MDWHVMSSSVIARVAYDEVSRTLHIEFRSGTAYDYVDVPRNVYEELIVARSAGGYFAENIRNVYRFKQR